MKFGYSFKTSDGVRHEDVLEAKSREEVFETLRGRGLRPIRVWELRSRWRSALRASPVVILAMALAMALAYIAKPKVGGERRESAAIVELRVKTTALANRHKADIILAGDDLDKVEEAVERTREEARQLFKDILAGVADPDEQLEAKRLYGELMLLTDVAGEEL